MIKNSWEHQNLLLQPILHPRPKWYEKNMEQKIMQVRNDNKRFTSFPAMIKMKNMSLIKEIIFLRTLMNPLLLSKNFGDKIPTFHD